MLKNHHLRGALAAAALAAALAGCGSVHGPSLGPGAPARAVQSDPNANADPVVPSGPAGDAIAGPVLVP